MNIYKELRKKKGLTQTELAKILNLNQTTIGKWENNNLKVIPDYTTLIALSKLYGVTTDYLLGNSTELTTTSTSITQEQAKELWFSTLTPIQQELINNILRLNELQQLKAQAYFAGLL